MIRELREFYEWGAEQFDGFEASARALGAAVAAGKHAAPLELSRLR
jgi:hypothetical protein